MKKIRLMCVLALASIACLGNQAQCVYADEESISSSSSVSQQSDEGELEELREFKDKVVEFKDSVLVPFLGSISITSILALVGTFVMNYLKGKKVDKKLVEAESKLAEATIIIGTISKIYEDLKEGNKINAETKALMVEKLAELEKIVKENVDNVDKIEKLENVIKLLIQLEAKLAEVNPQLIASGAIDDVNQVITIIKSM